MTSASAFLIGFAAAFSATAILLAGRPQPVPEAPPPPRSAVQMLRAQHGTLSPWEELQMAIIYTESRFDPTAVGTCQDFGLYQMTPIYVQEVNRVAGTDYAHTDAFDPGTVLLVSSGSVRRIDSGSPSRGLSVPSHASAPTSFETAQPIFAVTVVCAKQVLSARTPRSRPAA